ncbi:MAG: hypothetical protein M3Z09_02655 [Acidobacteriota bacterium]|nr:hypothetical protein [Acidobacteriota bacterium]
MRQHRRLAGLVLGTSALAGTICFTGVHLLRTPGVVRAQNKLSGPTHREAGYVTPEACAGCHRDIWETYRRTGMARSFYRPAPANTIEDYTKNNTFYHQPSDSYFTMLRRDGKYYQRRYQIDLNGNQINPVEKQIDFILGSGNHSRAYLHRTAQNKLIELPLAWYAEQGGYWAMNPGYDRPHHDGFRREITYDCMFCHNRYPEIPAENDQPFAEPVYADTLPEGIDCQRCHGPGRTHAQLAKISGAKPEDIRNPSLTRHASGRSARWKSVCSAILRPPAFPCRTRFSGMSEARSLTGRVSLWPRSS